MRQWSIEIVMLDKEGNELPATILDRVTYHLHPTFVNPNRTFQDSPFRIEEQGWGGFPLNISLFLLEKAGERKITHDLNFLQDSYQVDHVIQVPVNKPALVTELAKSGPMVEITALTANLGTKRKSTAIVAEPKPKKTKMTTGTIPVTSPVLMKGDVDIERLAFGLTKLKEDDLVNIVQMIMDNQTPDMDASNNVEEGEFVFDFFTFPEDLLKSLWEYVKSNVPAKDLK